MTTLKIKTPRWFKPFLKPSRYKGAHGGRGSGKSHAFAEMVIEAHVMDQRRRTVCVREIQKSLAQSVKRLLELKIEQLGVQDYFEIQESADQVRAWRWANHLPGDAEPHCRFH
jgi:phage terminase large subunit